MAEPAQPVVEGLEPFEILFGENQEGVESLAVLRKPDGCQISRWALTEDERQALVHDDADVFVYQHTFFNPPMPLYVQILPKRLDAEATRDALNLNKELDNRIASGQINQAALMAISDREAQIMAHPKMFMEPGDYYDAVEMLRDKWRKRPASQAEMDFEEFQVCEITRLTALLMQTLKTL